MRAIANGSIDTADDPTHHVIEAVRKSLADLDGYPVTDLTDDIEMAELIGRFKALVGVLVTTIDH